MSRFKLKHWHRRRLQRQLRETSDVRLSRKTLAMLELDRGRSAADIAETLGVTRQTVPNWAAASARQSDPSALVDHYGQGRHRLLTEDIEDLLPNLAVKPPALAVGI